MKPLDIDEIDLDKDEDVFYSCLRLAEDEFWNLVDIDGVFFYGKIIEEDMYQERIYDENKTYCRCPVCNEVFELDESKQFAGGDITCPHCGEDGILADFHDRSMPLDDMCVQNIAYMQTYEDGFCLRLFKAYADYSGRDYDDYTTLEYCPSMRFFEYGREYYHDGQIKYFVSFQEDQIDALDTLWAEVNNIDDDGFLISNAGEVEELCNSPYVGDLKGDDDFREPIMYHFAKSLSYNAFRTLQKYGFKELVDDIIYVANEFPDSSKISEILGVDYNQITAYAGKDITLKELLFARKLYRLDVPPSNQNIELMIQMNGIEEGRGNFKLTADNARKTFKYLRNQSNKSKQKSVGRDYADYLRECEQLAFDLSDTRVLYPTDLLQAHARTSKLIEIKKNEKTELGVMKAYKKYHDLCSYDNGKLCVIMPQCCEEIIDEGKIQSHCVGKYIERVANGEDIILFVRHSAEKNKPFYTLEIRPIMRKLDIVQCRGYENEDKSPEIRAEIDAFLAEYENWFNHRKANKRDKTKRIYYKAVKKIDGKYISAWDNATEYIPGQVLEAVTDKNPDRVAVKGIHIASLEFAQNYGKAWGDVAILELEVDIKDIVVPNAKDQVRASRVKVLREVPFEEMGEWGQERLKKAT